MHVYAAVLLKIQFVILDNRKLSDFIFFVDYPIRSTFIREATAESTDLRAVLMLLRL